MSTLRSDGLGPDTPPRDIHSRIPVLFNPFLRLVLFVALLVLATFLCGALVTIFAGPQDFASKEFHVLPRLVTLVGITAAYLILITLIERRRPPVELAPRRIGGLAAGLGIGAASMLVCFGLALAVGAWRLDGPRTPDWAHWAAMIFMVGVVAGVTEEIISRGILFRIGEELIGTWAALVLSSVIFGALHLGNPDATVAGAVSAGLGGLVLALLYAVTRSLWVPIGFHIAWNAVQGPILGIPISGTGDPDGLLTVHPAGSALLSGGKFGIEASLFTLLVLMALSAYLVVRLARSGHVIAPMWTRRARQHGAVPPAATPPAAGGPADPAFAPVPHGAGA